MNTDSFQTLEIPLNKLLARNENVRTTGADVGIDELAASIASVGLLQGLVVKKEPRGRYAVIAGRRRLLALSHLASDGILKNTQPIPCRLAPDDADLVEISLTENVQRQTMNPVDELLAFLRLIEAGKSVADVAARFGVSEAVVTRRLALARVSPRLLEEYRAGNLTLDVLQAFTLTDDHAIQETVWTELATWDRSARAVRQMISGGSTPATDKRVRFVGLDTYELAGGTVRRDLFAEGDLGISIDDPITLNRLVSDKLQGVADALHSEGWKWVELQPELNYQSISRFKRIQPTLPPLPSKAQAKVAALDKQREALLNRVEETEGDDSVDHALYDQIDQIEEQVREIQSKQQRIYRDDVKGICGVVVTIGQNGEPEFVCGLLRKEDEAALATDETLSGEESQPAQASENTAESTKYSAALLESLTEHKTAAIAAELTAQPTIALAALVHALTLSHFGLDLHLYRAKSSLQVSITQAHLEGANGSPALTQLEEHGQSWFQKLPKDSTELWHWCLQQDSGTLLQLLAYCMARSLNGVQSKNNNGRERLEHANDLAVALQVDMTKWFTPTAENFFGRIPKFRIAEALEEVGKPATAATLALKKPDLATVAEKEIRGTGWLPKPIRVLD